MFYWCFTVRRFRLFFDNGYSEITSRKRKNYSLRNGLDANAPDVAAAARKVAAFENRTKFTLLSKTDQKLFKVIRQIEPMTSLPRHKCSYVFVAKLKKSGLKWFCLVKVQMKL
jgi:hypothetical protein